MKFFFFFFPLFLMLECSQVGGVRETEAHNRTGRRQLALLHTRMAAGGGEGGLNQKPKKICTTTSVDRKQSGGHLMARDASQCHIL